MSTPWCVWPDAWRTPAVDERRRSGDRAVHAAEPPLERHGGAMGGRGPAGSRSRVCRRVEQRLLTARRSALEGFVRFRRASFCSCDLFLVQLDELGPATARGRRRRRSHPRFTCDSISAASDSSAIVLGTEQHLEHVPAARHVELLARSTTIFTSFASLLLRARRCAPRSRATSMVGVPRVRSSSSSIVTACSSSRIALADGHPAP